MLENLYSIPWQELSHFSITNNDASNIPIAIQNLTSFDRSIRQKAISTLYEDLFHQYTICEVTSIAIPFLIELLADENVEDKEEILRFLDSITIEYPFTIHYSELFSIRPSWDSHYSECEWIGQIFDPVICKIQKGCSIYDRLLKQESLEVRVLSAHLLGLFPNCAEQNLNRLKFHFDSEENEIVRSAIILSIGLLSREKTEHITWLEDIFKTETNLFIQINVAIALCSLNSEFVSESTIDLLVNSIVNPSDVAPKFDRFPWNNDNYSSDTLQSWCSLALIYAVKRNRQLLPKLLPTLINYLDIILSSNIDNVVYCLIDLIFNDRAISSTMTIERLSHEQHLVLEAIANNKQFWLAENYTISEKFSFLKSFGLPPKQNQLRAFLSGEITLSEVALDREIPF